MNGYATIGLCALALTAIAAHSLGVGGTGTPTIVSPYSVPLVLPAFMGVPRLVVGMAVGLVFAAWSRQMLRQEFHIPRRSLVLFVAGIVLSVTNFIAGWPDGVQFQGRAYVATCLGISIALALILTVILLRNRAVPSARNFLAFHVGLFGWLATYAIPYLGEGP